jgi:hypothetical protein
MNNVVRLFRNKVDGVPSKPVGIATAVMNIFVANVDLARAFKELSERFDAIENAIASIDDAVTRSTLREPTRFSREALSTAVLQLTQQIGKLVIRHGV